MVIMNKFLLQAALTGGAFAAAVYPTGTASASAAGSLPTVDLGYEMHQAASFNTTAQIYKFNSIRYAAPPVGNLAFAPPSAPVNNRANVQNGAAGKNCYDAYPQWVLDQFKGSKLKRRGESDKDTTPKGQDCLFLDVFTTKKNFDSKAKAPVLVWIHGGGVVLGNKAEYEPWTLMGRKKDGMVLVAINYRLGAFGWMAGDSLTAGGGSTNLGLRDQRFALEWVQKNIAKFGGDPSKVTIMGESAGGDSVVYQITAYGGTKPVPFARAIPQSPSSYVQSKCDAEKNYKKYLATAGCSNTDPKAAMSCLRKKSGDELAAANQKMVYGAFFGLFEFSCSIDGDIVPDATSLMLRNGQHAKNVQVMSGHNSDEGFLFTDPKISKDDDFRNYVIGNVPSADNKTISDLCNSVYPPPSKNTPYKNNFERASLFQAELSYTCSTTFVSKAFRNQTYNYFFTAGKGQHGDDVPYTFYNGGDNTTDPNVAQDLQDYITSFVIDGKPVSQRKGAPAFPQYGNSQVMKLSNGGQETVVTDPAANSRCLYLEQATYLNACKGNSTKIPPVAPFNSGASRTRGVEASPLLVIQILAATLLFSLL